MASLVEQNPENHPERPSGPSHSTGPEDDVSDAPVSSDLEAQADDLPDIVDLVLEMGRTPEEPSAEGFVANLLSTLAVA